MAGSTTRVKDDGLPEPASLELHPERQAMLDVPEVVDGQGPHANRKGRENMKAPRERWRKPKISRFAKEQEIAKQRQEKMEANKRAREEREMDRRAMTKARKRGKDGKIKLGRQSQVLLNRVKRMVAEDGH